MILMKMNRDLLEEEGRRVCTTPWSEGDNQSMAQDTQACLGRELLCPNTTREAGGDPGPATTAALAAQCHSLVGVTKIQLFCWSVFGLSCEVGTQLQTNASQRLWLEKQLLFLPGCVVYLQKCYSL